MCYSIDNGKGKGPDPSYSEHTMTKHHNTHFVVFDSDANHNLFDIETFETEFETQQKAFDVAKVWKKATGHTLTIKCIYTVEADFITF